MLLCRCRCCNSRRDKLVLKAVSHVKNEMRITELLKFIRVTRQAIKQMVDPITLRAIEEKHSLIVIESENDGGSEFNAIAASYEVASMAQ